MFDSSEHTPLWTQPHGDQNVHHTQGLDMLPKYVECYDIQGDHNGRRNIQLHIMHICTASSVT